MRFTKIKIFLFFILLFVLIIFIIQFKKSMINTETVNKIKFKEEFTGIVTKIYSQRGFFIVYKNINTLKFNEIYVTSDLALNLKLNDTIIKLPNSNSCKLKNKVFKLYENDFINDLEKSNYNFENVSSSKNSK